MVKNHLKRLVNCNSTFYDPFNRSGGPLVFCGSGCCPKTTKNGLNSQSVEHPQSRKMRQANYAKNVNRGRVVYTYGSSEYSDSVFQTNNPFVVNYLGRMEGQLGGSGQPPRNRLL
jgi:hypothetical protein